MKMSKGQGISLFIAFVFFGIFNVIVFLAPLAHSVVFWLGYFFALFALVTMAVTLFLYSKKAVKEEKFLNLPAVKVAWTYFVLQTALSVWEMIAFPLSYLPALIINLLLSAIFVVIILALYASAGKIERAEQYTAEKVIYIKQLKLKLDSIETDDAELAKKIKELSDDVRFSDQMSHSKLETIESEIDYITDKLVDNIGNKDAALELCAKVAKLLKTRNEQCKMYKGVKDEVAAEAQKSTNGLGIAFAGACATLALFLITLAVCFYIIPQVKYNDAIALMEAEKYAEATVAFTELGDYRDSEKKIDEIKTILLDNQYNSATALMEAAKYDEAIVAFTALGDYRDSKEKVEEIKNIVLNQQYDEAEKLFNNGNYSEAINIYSALGDFKDSKLRIEQIYNRVSDGDIIYFGTYNNTPIAWKILKTEGDKMLLIADKPIAQKPFHDEIKKVTWETSSLRAWLNSEFMESFSAEQKNQILVTETLKTSDKVFLLNIEEIDELSKSVAFGTSEEWWTRTAIDESIMYMTATGWLKAEGDHVVRDKGVRPAIWINLK